MLAHYREMLAFRKKHPVLLAGDIRFVDAPDGVLTFERGSDAARMLCVFNIAREPVTFELPKELCEARFIDVPGFPAPAPEEKTILLPPLGAAFGIIA
jgi:alpha-glucosidase